MAPPLLAPWRDEAAYQPLLGAERTVFAWEWLRRNEAYDEAARAVLGPRGADSSPRPGKAAARWGLHAFESPDLGAPVARPMWRADFHPSVLTLVRCPSPRGSGTFDLELVVPTATRLMGEDGCEHWLLSDGLRSLRLDLLGGVPRAGQGTLGCLLPPLLDREGALLPLRQLVALCRTGEFSTRLHRPERRARRWIAMLRAHDALAAGASQREIAAVLLGEEARAPRWRIEAPSLRSQVQRLVHSVRAMADGGYRLLLANETRDRRA